MKTLGLVGAATVIAVCVVAYVSATPADAAEEPEIGMVVGEVIDIGNYAMKGLRGEENAAAGRYRSDLGFPIGILEDETGRVYIALYRLPVPAAGVQTGNTVLSPYMGKRVVAQGTKYHAEGVNVLRISLVTEY